MVTSILSASRCSRFILSAFLAICFVGFVSCPLLGKGGQLRLRVIDKKSRLPMAVRIHLTSASGKPKRIPGSPFLKDHSVLEGEVTLELSPGDYRFHIESGLEYRQVEGGFHIEKGSDDTHMVEMERFVDMARDGWWSGDLWASRPLETMSLLMAAEDLHFVAHSAESVKSQAVFSPVSGELPKDTWIDANNQVFETSGGRLLIHKLPKPLLRKTVVSGSDASSAELLLAAAPQGSKRGCVADLASWDLPIWIASGRIGLALVMGPETLGERSTDENKTRRPFDPVLFPAPHSQGRWREYIYYQLLECGLRIPPGAGSGSGEYPLPLGSNRVYAQLTSVVSQDAWWNALQDGKVFVTNGPLMNPSVNGRPPGSVFQAPAGEQVVLQPELTLRTREPIAYLEIIKNGRTAHSISLEQFKDRSGRLPPVEFDESGWMAIRAITDNSASYRLAMSGAFYVEIGGVNRVSRDAVQFFLDWENERTQRPQAAGGEKNKAAEALHRATIAYWEKLKSQASSDNHETQ